MSSKRSVSEDTFDWWGISDTLFAASWNNNTQIALWNTSDNACIMKFAIDNCDSGGQNYKLSPTGNYLAMFDIDVVRSQTTVKFNAISTEVKVKKVVFQKENMDGKTGVFSNDGNMFYCGNQFSKLVVAIHIETETFDLYTCKFEAKDEERGLKISSDGLFAIFLFPRYAVVWSLKENKEVSRIEYIYGITNENCAISRDNTRFFIDDAGVCLSAFNIITGNLEWQYQNHGVFADSTSDGKYIAIFEKQKKEIVTLNAQTAVELFRNNVQYDDIELIFIPFSTNYLFVPAFENKMIHKELSLGRIDNFLTIVNSLNGKLIAKIDIKNPFPQTPAQSQKKPAKLNDQNEKTSIRTIVFVVISMICFILLSFWVYKKCVKNKIIH